MFAVRLLRHKVVERFHDPGHVLVKAMQFENLRGLENQLEFEITDFVDHFYEYSGFVDFDRRAILVVDHITDLLRMAVCGWVGGGGGVNDQGPLAAQKVRGPEVGRPPAFTGDICAVFDFG